MTSWAFATLGVYNARLMEAIAERVMEEGFLKTCTSQGLAMTAWAFASLDIRNDALTDAFAARVAEPGFLDTFSPKSMAMTSWAFATFGILNVQLMQRIAEHLLQDEFYDGLTPQVKWGVVWLCLAGLTRSAVPPPLPPSLPPCHSAAGPFAATVQQRCRGSAGAQRTRVITLLPTTISSMPHGLCSHPFHSTAAVVVL